MLLLSVEVMPSSTFQGMIRRGSLPKTYLRQYTIASYYIILLTKTVKNLSPMKLSDRTFKVLRNLTSINRSIQFKQGSQLSTLSIQKNVLASTAIEEIFPRDFAIYDLDEFLKICSLSEDMDIDLEFENDNYVTIKGRNSKAKYFFADPSIVISPPEKMPELPTVDCEFDISIGQLRSLSQALSIYGNIDDFSIIGGNGKITIVVADRENKSSNTYAIKVGETDATFQFNLKSENIGKIEQSPQIVTGYHVEVSRSGVSRWVSSDDVTYLIALEPDSTYEED